MKKMSREFEIQEFPESTKRTEEGFSSPFWHNLRLFKQIPFPAKSPLCISVRKFQTCYELHSLQSTLARMSPKKRLSGPGEF